MGDGTIVAGRAVRLAAARHLRDRERQGAPDWPYVFDAGRARHCLEFFSTYLTLDEGQAFALPRWLQFCFGSLVGWVTREGRRRFQQAYLCTAKGSGKTPALAGFGLYGLVGESRRASEIYSLGVNADQANYLYQFAKRMVQRSEALAGLLEAGERSIAWVGHTSFFRPLASEGRSLDNKRVFMALIDELHEHPDATIPEKMRLGVKNQTDALIVEITNTGHDQTSVCWAHHEYSMQVLDETLADDRWFAYVCQLDPCDACRAQGLSQPSDGCPACDDWTDERAWAKANPALDEVTTREYLRGVVQMALHQPSMQARVKRLNFCLWTQSHTAWILADQWARCRATPGAMPAPSVTAACAAGLDLSDKLDLTACVVARRIDDTAGATEDTVSITDTEDGADVRRTLTINFRVALSTYFWLPADTLRDRETHERVPFGVWRAGGFLRVTPGPVIDHDLMYEQIRDEIGPMFRPQRIGYDEHNATQFAVQLRDRAKFEVVAVPQGRRLSETFKLFEALIRLGRILHDGNPVMAWCVANAEPKFDRYQNLWIEKPSKTKRIDGVIAAVVALNQLVLLPARRPTAARAPRIWTPAGFVPAAAANSAP